MPQQQGPQVPQASTAAGGPSGSGLSAGTGDWPAFRRSAERTGNSAGFAVHAQDVTQLAEKWSQTVGETVTSAVAVGDSVFVGSKDHGLYSFNADTGAIKWREQTKGAVQALPSVGAGLIVFASDDGSVYALDAATGKERWSHAGGYGASSPLVVETAQPGDTLIYVGGSGGNIDALDIGGNVKWSAATGGAIESSPAVKADVVYVGSSDGRLHAFNARTGAARWSFLTGGPVTATPAVDHGKVYVGSNDSKLYAIDADTGVPVWSQVTKGPIRASAAVGEVEGLPGPSVFVGSSDGALYAFDATTGQLRWSPINFNGPIASSPALGLDVLFMSANDNVLAVSPLNGAILWDASLVGARDTSPALARDKVLATAGNSIHAFALSTPAPAQAPVPPSAPAAIPSAPPSCGGSPVAACPRCAGSPGLPCPGCASPPVNGRTGACPSAP
ncbi:PQQ-binding-like beta-propeller repeat protein [Streptomyces sp. NPDC001404]|uniref:outer membrane protein assembly factor BamB family protein n=1 Tax=Streptomyces sp. NPDC001404 TaxID=3364571 RepID=UPI00368FFA78